MSEARENEFSRAAASLSCAGPFLKFFSDPAVTELCVNRPGSVWTETSGVWKELPAPEITFGRCAALATSAAVYAGLPFGPEDPLLSVTLPGGERAQFAAPPAVTPETVSVTLRRPGDRLLGLREFEQSGFFRIPRGGFAKTPDSELLALRREMRSAPGTELEPLFPRFFRAAVNAKKNIVVCGETGSGKTTFMKALLREIPDSERLVTIEDVPELASGLPGHGNQVNLFYPSEGRGGVTASDLIRCALRMKPDRILLGEIRGPEAYDYLSAALSGHGGSVTSCHAGSCAEAFETLTLRVLQSKAGSGMTPDAVRRLFLLTTDIVLHVRAEGGKRFLSELWFKPEAPEGPEPRLSAPFPDFSKERRPK